MLYLKNIDLYGELPHGGYVNYDKVQKNCNKG